MYFLPISLAIFLLFLFMIPVLFVVAPAVAFNKLGLDPVCGYVFFIICLLGGAVNIPVRREKFRYTTSVDNIHAMFSDFFGIKIPRVGERVIAVNLGGAVLPCLLSIFLLFRVPLGITLLATVITSFTAYKMSKPVKGIGIVLPAFVPPVVAALTALVLARENAPQVAYISGVMGTLIGADLLRINQLKSMEAPFLSIGGAGIFDGIYLVGLVSVLLA
jgi:uncharacterized membrane protein